ncbi:DUF881 domain-containing protein [Blastococcus sp. BMG 814]|uniref:DUF881 domain-containing protein n=1 Tax=Blastococcus carthaginiensis TaxID=3050034 RepID=A0ABT9IA31_9ACTN|nr:DUF881 domain-containing protein [Blastococcus carthaginiensis]MDP5182430.1 DUF881 domain-containing protein [Blastococcus carthaginiensis]
MDGDERRATGGDGPPLGPASADVGAAAAPAPGDAVAGDAVAGDAVAGDAVAGPAPNEQPSTSTRGSGPARLWSRPVAVAATAGLTVVLGFALVVQIRSTAEPAEQDVRSEADLVVLLDELNAQEETLRQEIGATRETLEQLGSGQEESGSALEEARSRAEAIGILAGTLPVSGPGVLVTVQDPDGAVPASVVLGAIQELRGAGAEALQVDGVRVVASSAVTGSPGALRIDGQPLSSPYEFRAIGPPAAMEIALSVTGGVLADIGREGARVRVERADDVRVDATVD